MRLVFTQIHSSSSAIHKSMKTFLASTYPGIMLSIRPDGAANHQPDAVFSITNTFWTYDLNPRRKCFIEVSPRPFSWVLAYCLYHHQVANPPVRYIPDSKLVHLFQFSAFHQISWSSRWVMPMQELSPIALDHDRDGFKWFSNCFGLRIQGVNLKA